MSICQHCQAREERPCTYAPRTLEFYNAIMPALRFVAHNCGYALAVHGSLKTDIDLLAVPWRDSAIRAESLAEEIRLTAERIIGTARVREGDQNPFKKPAGRLAWVFYLQPEGVEGPYIDLSVIPPLPATTRADVNHLLACVLALQENGVATLQKEDAEKVNRIEERWRA